MKRVKFKEKQIIGILKEQEAGAKTADVCRKHGISGATFLQVGKPNTAALRSRKPGV
jgi:hypothetical protein